MKFHDRFLIIDEDKAYHIGASFKDAGKKCFAITLLKNNGIVKDILQRLEFETEEKPVWQLWQIETDFFLCKNSLLSPTENINSVSPHLSPAPYGKPILTEITMPLVVSETNLQKLLFGTDLHCTLCRTIEKLKSACNEVEVQ